MPIYMSEQAAEALFRDELYPLHPHLAALFAAKGIEEFDVNTVLQVAYSLLNQTPSLETFFEVELEVESLDVLTRPDLLSLCTSTHLLSDLARCLVLIALLRSHGVADHILIVKPWQGGTEVQVQALIDPTRLVHYRPDIGPIPIPPDLFEGSVVVCHNFRQLLQAVDEKAVLQAASNPADVELAIRVALYKVGMERGQNSEWNSPIRFLLGKNFHESLTCCLACNSENMVGRLLGTVIEAIQGENLGQLHSLRTSTGGGSSQRMRGSDKACRRDIDRQYHLHYWQRTDGTVELSDIVTHDNFVITY